ncbi:MAG: hypothetical protein ACTSVI_14935 [Promethearchaeota archaeon]
MVEASQIAAFFARLSLAFIYFGVFFFFKKNYVKAKKNGFVNKFFLGYAAFYIFLFGFQVTQVIYALDRDILATNFFESASQMFPLPPGSSTDSVPYLSNLVRPLYVFGLAALSCLVGMQIYPLELVINWKKWPITKFLLVTAAGLMLVFIPAFTWTLYSFFIFLACLIGIILGLILNIGVNIKLAFVSTGELRKRSIFIIFASLLFYLGFLWTLEIKEISLMVPLGLNSDFDIVFGSIIQGISSACYFIGLRSKGY